MGTARPPAGPRAEPVGASLAVPDFHQSGSITTLHDLGSIAPDRLETLLEEFTQDCRLGLVLPVTASDARAEPFADIMAKLEGVRWIEEIVVVLGRAEDVADYRYVRGLVEPLGDRAQVLWADGPRFRQLADLLHEADIHFPTPGKGSSVWAAFGYLLGAPDLKAFVLHDCDIVGYERSMLARLCLPMALPSLDFEYCKAYYARVSDRMYGRMTRLLVTPLLHSLNTTYPGNPFLRYMNSFRYPLSGEFAIASTLARSNRVPGHWGLEIGTLAEVYRNTSVKRVCQVDLGVSYEHKHQELSIGDPSQGLMRMAQEIIATLFRTMGSMGVTLERGTTMLRSLYLRTAQDSIRQYHADALFNGLPLDRHEEEQTVEAIARQIAVAGDAYQDDPAGEPPIPNWARTLAVFPEFPHQLRQAAVEEARHSG